MTQSCVGQTTQPSLAHSSENKSCDNFRGYPKAGEHKRQQSRTKRRIIPTNTSEDDALMEEKRLSEGTVLEHQLEKYCEDEKREQKWFTVDVMRRRVSGQNG
jgi:hypothetical protein